MGSPCATKSACLPAVRHSIERRSTVPLALFARAGGEHMMMAGPAASKSVRSLATLILARGPHQGGNKVARRGVDSDPWLDSGRSSCLIAGLVGRPRAGARPWPVVLTGRRSGLDDAEGGVGQGRACHAGRRRTGRQESGGLPKSRGSGCGSRLCENAMDDMIPF
jgi:hypothetical protein